jgi:uncharacterized spore protein YtfJ
MKGQRGVGAVRKVLSVRRVFGEPIEVDGMTIIPAARVKGRAGGRRGEAGKKEGGAEGFAVSARPAGAFVVRDGKVSWQPAVDVNRIVAGGQLLGLMGMLTYIFWFRSRLRSGHRR